MGALLALLGQLSLAWNMKEPTSEMWCHVAGAGFINEVNQVVCSHTQAIVTGLSTTVAKAQTEFLSLIEIMLS